MREQIVSEIKAGAFVFSAHFPDYRFIAKQAPVEVEQASRTFGEWAAVWLKLAARDHERSTMTIYRRVLNTYWMPVFGGLMPRAVTTEKILLRLSEISEPWTNAEGRAMKPSGRKSQNNILIPLRKVFELIGGASPCAPIKNQKTQKAQPDPFTAEEVEVVLAALQRRSAEMADYFEFAFFAGLRVSEQIALLWQDVDLHGGTIVVRRARVEGVDKERTKTNVERTVELNDRALAVLMRQKARTYLAGAEVFINPSTGRRYHDEQVQARVWAAAIKLSGVRYRAPKETRDTSVTLALMAGADPVWVASQHGHSVQVMMKDYAKFIPRADRGRNLNAVNAALTAGEPAERKFG